MADAEHKLGEAIAFFEQMLQTMPGDRTSLEFLSVAYEQTNQTDKHRDCLIRLVECLIREQDLENAQVISERLKAYPDDPASCAIIMRINGLLGALKPEKAIETTVQIQQLPLPQEPANIHSRASVSFPDPSMEVHALSRSTASAEMDLVWFWKEREILSKEICMDVLHILAERPVSDVPVLISALALLDEQHPELTDHVMEAMQQASELPAIPLELFELQAAAKALLSPNFVLIKGTVPFAIMGGEALIGLLNPLNAALKEEVITRAGCPCHFFFVHPKSLQEACKAFSS